MLKSKILFKEKDFSGALSILSSLIKYVNKLERSKVAIEIYYWQGKIFEKLRIKDRSFESFKTARKKAESSKGEDFYIEMRDLIDDAILNFK